MFLLSVCSLMVRQRGESTQQTGLALVAYPCKHEKSRWHLWHVSKHTGGSLVKLCSLTHSTRGPLQAKSGLQQSLGLGFSPMAQGPFLKYLFFSIHFHWNWVCCFHNIKQSHKNLECKSKDIVMRLYNALVSLCWILVTTLPKGHCGPIKSNQTNTMV